mmetsp:Transcript_28660/g.48766  ORF Transcript_28660/g.48766 Transcript_28660/m.48766 type:complete len:207 (+) Transcript_28660:269-889(+)
MCSKDARETFCVPLFSLPFRLRHHPSKVVPGRDPNLLPNRETPNGHSPNNTLKGAIRGYRGISIALVQYRHFPDLHRRMMVHDCCCDDCHYRHQYGFLFAVLLLVGCSIVPYDNIQSPQSRGNTSYKMPPGTPCRTRRASRNGFASSRTTTMMDEDNHHDDLWKQRSRKKKKKWSFRSARQRKPPPNGAAPPRIRTPSRDTRKWRD